MFRDFLKNNNRSILIITILIGGWLLLYFFKGDDTGKLIANPKVGMIYIFQEDEVYAPMRIDSIAEQQLYMRNYLFTFVDAVPKRKQIIAEEFDLNFYAIYEKREIRRLYEVGNIVKVYP
ncbi:MAG: hypothetical protein P8I55_16050 [Crocinitomix sp.]|nr:hypothetical protein [Crocinitomix sp.]